jgi:hypothetical protein
MINVTYLNEAHYLPHYPVLTAKKQEESKSLSMKLNYIIFYHRALHIILRKLLALEKDPDGLQVDIPGMGCIYLHVKLAFIVGNIKGQNTMACHDGSFRSNVK